MLSHILKAKKLVLGSASPRREELLKLLGVDFEIRISNTNECFDKQLSPKNVAKVLAEKKSAALINSLVKLQ